MNEEGCNADKELTGQGVDEDTAILAAKETSSALPDEGLNAIVRFLARRAAEHDFAAFVNGLLSGDNFKER